MNTQSKITNSAGVTLIEVLVAIVITSIGILGFASLQFLGLNSNQSAYYRSQASFVATDLSERMRANMDGMNANNYENLSSAALDCTTLPAPYCDARNNAGTQIPAANCTPAQLAAHDLFVAFCGYSANGYADNSAEKTTSLADILPAAVITVGCNDSDPLDADTCTDFSDHTISVSWQEQDEGTTGGRLQMQSNQQRTIIYRFRP